MYTLTIKHNGEAEVIEGTLEEVTPELNKRQSERSYELMILKSPSNISTHYRNKVTKR